MNSTPSHTLTWAEVQLRLQEALNSMDAIDHKVLVLKHFEELSNDETAEIFYSQKSAASNRYVGALKRLRRILRSMPGFSEP